MTDKEKELQAEAIGYYRKRIAELEMTVGTLRNFSNEQATCIERLEKENKELGKACEETQELLDKQIEATYKLDKENAELKDYRLTTLAKQQTGMSKYALNLEHKLSWYDDQLTKAKEYIKLLLMNCIGVYESTGKTIAEIQAEAEQFLKDSEVEK